MSIFYAHPDDVDLWIGGILRPCLQQLIEGYPRILMIF